MSDNAFEVRASGIGAYAEGQLVRPPLAKMGLPVSLSKWDHFALMGRMFNVKQTTIGTALSGGTADNGGIVLTVPWVQFTVPDGTTVFPRHLNLALSAAAGTLNEIALVYTATDSYTSGGTALTPLNWRSSGGVATSVTGCVIGPSGGVITEAALVGVRALYQDILPAAFTASFLSYRINQYFDDLIPVMGPASVILYLTGATTTPAGYFSLDWAEVPSSSL
jgi:hypothetical protein